MERDTDRKKGRDMNRGRDIDNGHGKQLRAQGQEQGVVTRDKYPEKDRDRKKDTDTETVRVTNWIGTRNGHGQVQGH